MAFQLPQQYYVPQPSAPALPSGPVPIMAHQQAQQQQVPPAMMYAPSPSQPVVIYAPPPPVVYAAPRAYIYTGHHHGHHHRHHWWSSLMKAGRHAHTPTSTYILKLSPPVSCLLGYHRTLYAWQYDDIYLAFIICNQQQRDVVMQACSTYCVR